MRELSDPQCVEAAVAAQLTRFAAFADGPLALAVSGGGDSTALAWLAARWARSSGRKLVCITVDHRLRPESAGEALSVARMCAGLGLAHETLRWRAPRPRQAAARRARYELLGEAARRHGARLVATGHTLDDQMETFLMRVRAGSGWFGLAGMDALAVLPVWPGGRGIALLRPLLDVRRAALRSVLRAAGMDWIEDPTNESLVHERVRMRAILAGTPEVARRIENLLAGLGVLRRAELHALAACIETRVEPMADGTLWLDPVDLSRGRLVRLLAVLLPIAAGHDRRSRGGALEPLAEAVLAGGPERAQTLGGAWLARRKGGILLARDPGAVVSSGEVRDGLWDGRFEPAPGEWPPMSAPMARPGLPEGGQGWRAVTGERLAAQARTWRAL